MAARHGNDKVILHTIGDSHALYGWPMVQIPGYDVRCHHLGARLMHTVTTGKLDAVIQNACWHVDQGMVCFCFGEIDCRAHAHLHGQESLANKYLERIYALTPDRMTLVMGIVPPEREPRPVHNGSATQRLAYVQYLNGELARLAPGFGFRFVNVFPGYADAQGFMRSDLAGHQGHIGDHRPLQDAVCEAITT